jgi:hypothetical protein
MRNDEFQVILAEIEATVHAEVVVNIVHEEETLAAKLDRLRTGSLEVLEESLDDEDPKVRRETALSVARLTVGDKHQIDLNGRVGLTLDADTASAVQSALNDLKDLPVDRPARQPETPLLSGQS